ncbi:MAG: DNA-directed RNA polymerase subunit alpha C-terminal domain-containing protein [bacterium]
MAQSSVPPAIEVTESYEGMFMLFVKFARILTDVGISPTVLHRLVHEESLRHRFRAGLKKLVRELLLTDLPTTFEVQEFTDSPTNNMIWDVLKDVYSKVGRNSGLTHTMAQGENAHIIMEALSSDLMRSLVIQRYGLGNNGRGSSRQEMMSLFLVSETQLMKLLASLEAELRVIITRFEEHEPLDLPVECISANNRLTNILRRSGITTIRILCEKSPDELLKIHSMGGVYLREIEVELALRGLKLK